MPWFKKPPETPEGPETKKVRTEGLWIKCDGCRQIIWKKDLEGNMNVCPKCGQHFKVDALTRLAQLLDPVILALLELGLLIFSSDLKVPKHVLHETGPELALDILPGVEFDLRHILVKGELPLRLPRGAGVLRDLVDPALQRRGSGGAVRPAAHGTAAAGGGGRDDRRPPTDPR